MTTEMKTVNLDEKDLIGLMLEAGYCAAFRGLSKEAKSIFTGIIKVKPEMNAPKIGLALTDITLGKNRDAIRSLKSDAESSNEGDLYKVMIALALHQEGDLSKRNEIIDSISSNDTILKSTADALRTEKGKRK